MKIHQDVTLERVTQAVERGHCSLDNPGFAFVAAQKPTAWSRTRASMIAKRAEQPGSTAQKSC